MTFNKNKFELLNNFFDKIYVLTIARATERQTAFTKNFDGLNFTFFYGVDKKNLIENELIKNNEYDIELAKKLNRYNKPMKLGEIACSIGHKKIYEEIISKKYQKILILEDDVEIVESVLKNLHETFNHLPKNWDLIYFDYLKNEESNLLTTIKKFVYFLQKLFGKLSFSYKTISNLFATNYNNYFKKAGYHMFTSAYCINEKTAKILLQQQQPLKYIADHLLGYCITNELINGYIIKQKLFTQQSQTNKEQFGSLVEN